MTAVNKINGNIWLGVDLGTQSARAVAVSDTGQLFGEGSHPLTSRRDGPRHEQNPEDWWGAVASACRMALGQLSGSGIQRIAVDGTSGTILLIDNSGHAVTPGLMHDDMRATQEATRANEVGADTWASLGYRMQPSWALPKLLWLLRQHHDVPPRARLAHQADFINRRLAGHEIPSDSSNVLKTGYDLVRETWP
jgi:sugar (pentulose or hexulose) kinase